MPSPKKAPRSSSRGDRKKAITRDVSRQRREPELTSASSSEEVVLPVSVGVTNRVRATAEPSSSISSVLDSHEGAIRKLTRVIAIAACLQAGAALLLFWVSWGQTGAMQ